MANDAPKTPVPAQVSNPLSPAAASPAVHSRGSASRRLLLIGGGVVILLLGLWIGIPWVHRGLTTVSTDDAYVSDYVTFVAPRVVGQVVRVRVEDNNRVHKGDILLDLDPTPYQVQVAIADAALAAAQANLMVATATARGIVGQARGLRYNLQHAIEQVDDQIALLHSNVATLESQKATLALAQATFDRTEKLVGSHAVSQEEYDQARAALLVAKAQVQQALEGVHQTRVSLGLPASPPQGKDLTDVPDDLDETFSSVRQAQAQLIQAAAALGVVPSSYTMTPRQMIAAFMRRNPQGNIDLIYDEIVRKAPAVKQAEAKVVQARRDLDQAKLNLSYCSVLAEIDGVVSRRNVNPGTNVQAGQQVMALQAVDKLWIDANFKETQLANLRIGQRVDLYVDMYGDRKKFKGHISGFTMGTGSTIALLPAENATGNFVKVVQRLPVRIELDDYDPDRDPLFVGLSVTPYVFVKEKPTGPHAGEILQPYAPLHLEAPPDLGRAAESDAKPMGKRGPVISERPKDRPPPVSQPEPKP